MFFFNLLGRLGWFVLRRSNSCVDSVQKNYVLKFIRFQLLTKNIFAFSTPHMTLKRLDTLHAAIVRNSSFSTVATRISVGLATRSGVTLGLVGPCRATRPRECRTAVTK